MNFLDPTTIKLDKEINELDAFVLDFIRLVSQHIDYVIISGYVSILFGRSRSTEDVDVFIKPLPKERLTILYHDLQQHGYWCLNAESDDDIFSYLNDGLAVRFAKQGQAIPNIEVKFAKKLLDLAAFQDRLRVITPLGDLFVSSPERQIAFKRYYLCSPKDMEDARHIENIFKGHLRDDLIREYKKQIEQHLL